MRHRSENQSSKNLSNLKPDKLTEIMQRFHKEQQEFENHPLWQQLNTTPKEFFAKVNEYVKNSGIDKKVWEAKLAEARQVVETRVREQKADYKKTNFRNMSGLKV